MLSVLKSQVGTDCLSPVHALRPNSAFKPKLHRYAVNMAEKACHVASYALQFGLT
jgi:hypothetical protein